MEAKKPLKYLGYAVVCEEVPDEISLAFNISGCEHQCKDCHSKFLWQYEGNYISEDLSGVMSSYDGLITCVCFLGGDQNIDELSDLCARVKQMGLKTCIYSGADTTDLFTGLIENHLINYLKIGEYKFNRGGLSSPSTNQIFYKVNDSTLEDITYKFWRVYGRH